MGACGRVRQSREIINFLKEGIDFLREWVPAAGCGRVIIAVVVVGRSMELINFLKEFIDFLREWVGAAEWSSQSSRSSGCGRVGKSSISLRKFTIS